MIIYYRLFFYIIFVAIVVSSCDLKRIEDNSAPSTNGTKFQISLGGISEDSPRGVIATADGGFVIVGVSQSFSLNNNQAYLTKLDAKGKQLWESNFGGALDDSGNEVLATSDGGFLVYGSTRSFGTSQDLYLIKVNANGGKVWEKYYGVSDSTEVPIGIVPVGTAGDYLLAYNSAKSLGYYQLKFIRINSNGIRLSNKLVRSGFAFMVNMIRTSDAKIILVGSDSDKPGQIISKFNEDGSLIWENRTTGDLYNLVELNDKSIVITGNDGQNNSNFIMLNYDQIGGKIWGTNWGGAASDELFDIVKSNDGQVVVMGYTTSFNGISEFYLSKRKVSDGSKVWEKNYLNINNSLGHMAATLDGGYILVAPTSTSPSDIIVVKTDSNGEYK